MGNIFDEMRTALSKADAAQRAVDCNAKQMAEMLVGRLYHVGVHSCATRKRILGALKRELQRFNASTGYWK